MSSPLTLDRALGLPRAELMAIWEKVKANQARLNACPGPHDFRSIPGNERRQRCATCGGELDLCNVLYYQEGLKHGRAAAREVGNA
jgi:hypothetical protein